jgi:hypothetical protein
VLRYRRSFPVCLYFAAVVELSAMKVLCSWIMLVKVSMAIASISDEWMVCLAISCIST